MDKYEEMRTFIQVVDAGGITRAAEQLNIVKSAVSRRLNDLETRLGVQLFTRTTRKFNLTDMGRSYYEQCIRLINDLDEVEALVSQENKVLKGKLRITAPFSFGLAHLGPIISEFTTLYPDVSIEMDFNDRVVNVVEEGYDVALRIGNMKDSGLIAKNLFRVTLLPVATPAFVQKHGHIESIDDLVKLPFLGYKLGDDYLNYTAPDGQFGRIKPLMAHSFNNGDFLHQMVLGGLGYSILPTFIVYHSFNAKTLVPLLGDHQWGNTHAYAVYPSARHLSNKTRTFIDFISAAFSGTPFWEKY